MKVLFLLALVGLAALAAVPAVVVAEDVDPDADSNSADFDAEDTSKDASTEEAGAGKEDGKDDGSSDDDKGEPSDEELEKDLNAEKGASATSDENDEATTAPEVPVPAADFEPAAVLGYDLACSACEITVDKMLMAANIGWAKNATEEEKTTMAQNATKQACAMLVGVSTIGTYPGRKYDVYGYVSDKKSPPSDSQLDAQEACAYYMEKFGEAVADLLIKTKTTLTHKSVKTKSKDLVCGAKGANVCGNALASAMGAPGSSLCLVKAFKDAAGRRWGKAEKHATRCLKAAKKEEDGDEEKVETDKKKAEEDGEKTEATADTEESEEA